MRFLVDGPSIPNELLIARDEGRVLFFCGAGVSRARAGLPDFFGLADAVVQKLRVPASRPVCKLLREAREIDARVGVSGLLSADRMFGLLERDFATADIEQAVSQALKPNSMCDLSAHRMLLDLATTPQGSVRLVTTNFDRLFDDCGRDLPTWTPSRLPDLTRSSEFSGIVYLHGRAAHTYDGAEDGFVLSTSEFGRAYLSEGWATTFFRHVIRDYILVFVGYTADDPPVNYLFEALHRSAKTPLHLYAFQSGEQSEAVSRWLHKGVKAIPYRSLDAHNALWSTLEKWAERARDPNSWYTQVIEKAKAGPEQLEPFERGQVAHVVSTSDGARRFGAGDNVPPATWLCVFDPFRRFVTPGHAGSPYKRGPYVDPFDLFGIDSDPLPSKADPANLHYKREIPEGAWDAFASNSFDAREERPIDRAAFRGGGAAVIPSLPSRLRTLASWLARVSDQPAAVWWAAHQLALHPEIQRFVQWELSKSKDKFPPAVRQAWRFLFESRKHSKEDKFTEWTDLQECIQSDGWSEAVARRLSALSRPWLKASPPWRGPLPPSPDADKRVYDLVQLEVEYPSTPGMVDVPSDWLPSMLKEHRKNLELAASLETEIHGGFVFDQIDPIFFDQNEEDESFSPAFGLSASVLSFASLFRELAEHNPEACRREFLAWPDNDDAVFARLRVWAGGQFEFISGAEFGVVLDSLSDNCFWRSRQQRDLLIAISRRWSELTIEVQRGLATRIMAGPTRSGDEADETFIRGRAWSVLERITWLSAQGCELTSDLEAEVTKWSSIVPEWRPERVEKAVESLRSRGGYVRKNTDHSTLEGEELSSILSQAEAIRQTREDFLVENDPYGGLVVDRPVRAFSALVWESKQGKYRTWAWETFLSPESRKNDKDRLVCVIAERLFRQPEMALIALVRPVSRWLLEVRSKLVSSRPASFDRLAERLTNVIAQNPEIGRSALVRGNKDPDWTMEAINSPVGHLAQAVIQDPRSNSAKENHGARLH